ncbi:unnamed protein product [marine sediment metagenome]|uniref:Uncharacterized protein n=1 Tax=marine sediment metagenome TaxID=412755 RepID=X1QTT0_9ZZZZ
MKINVEVLEIIDRQLKAIEFEGIRYSLTEYEEPSQPVTKYKKKRKGKYWDETYQRETSKSEIDEVKKAMFCT